MEYTNTLRLAKSALVAVAGAWALLAAANNVIDYRPNFQYVQHVLEMDTTFPGNEHLGRAIRSTALQVVAYGAITATELLIGVLALLGAWQMARAARDADRFRGAKSIAVIALSLGVILWLFGFEVIAGEWFMMWQSHQWNAQEAAFRYVVGFGLVLIFVAASE